MTVDEAFEQCAYHARRHHENFLAGSWLLPRERRGDVRAVLAFASAAKDFADEAVASLDVPQRLELLERWEEQLELCVKGESKEPVFVALHQVIERHQLPVPLFRDLVSASRQDVTRGRYANFGELKDYCRRGANTIGRLVLHIFGHRDEERMRLSDRLCTALQLANFWRDVSVDLERDIIHLPGDEMESFGVAEGALKDRKFDEGFLRLMQFQVRRTREIFDSGRRLPNMLDGGLGRQIRLTWLRGVEILNKIEALGFDTMHWRPGISGWDSVRLLSRAALLKW